MFKWIYNWGFISPSSCVDAVRQKKQLCVLWGCLQRTVACTRVSPQMLQALSRPLPTSQSQVGDKFFGNLSKNMMETMVMILAKHRSIVHKDLHTDLFCTIYLFSITWWQQWDLEKQLWVQLHRDHRTRKARIVSNPKICLMFLMFLKHITAFLVLWSSSLLLRGRFSVTKRCDQRGSKRTVAAKYVNKKLLRREQVLQEIRLLQTLDHPNLVKLLDTYEMANSYVLVLEM